MFNEQVGKKGKHYVTSDIHGQYGTYLDMVNSLADEDTLYILGDVIDRGPNGIKILQDIMTRPNVRLVLGNHEWQMIQCYEIMKKHNLTVMEMSAYARMDFLIRSYDNGAGDISEDTYFNGIESIKDQIMAHGFEVKRFFRHELSAIGAWINNDALQTLKYFESLSEEEQEKIYKFLTESAITIYKKINGKDICLVHAAPYDGERLLELVEQADEEKTISFDSLADLGVDARKYLISMCTERRHRYFPKDKPTPFDKMHKLGFETIFGHTPQFDRATRSKKDGSLCLDVSKERLALYCIETGLVRYIEKSSEEPTGRMTEPEKPLLITDRSIDILSGQERKQVLKRLGEAHGMPGGTDNR